MVFLINLEHRGSFQLLQIIVCSPFVEILSGAMSY